MLWPHSRCLCLLLRRCTPCNLRAASRQGSMNQVGATHSRTTAPCSIAIGFAPVGARCVRPMLCIQPSDVVQHSGFLMLGKCRLGSTQWHGQGFSMWYNISVCKYQNMQPALSSRGSMPSCCRSIVRRKGKDATTRKMYKITREQGGRPSAAWPLPCCHASCYINRHTHSGLPSHLSVCRCNDVRLQVGWYQPVPV